MLLRRILLLPAHWYLTRGVVSQIYSATVAIDGEDRRETRHSPKSAPIPIIFDCDPGVDDAVMLLMALARRDVFDVLGITTVVGNVDISQVSDNALTILELARERRINVYAGCSRFIMGAPRLVRDSHGWNGLAGSSLPKPTTVIQTIHAVDFIISTVHSVASSSASRKLTISVSGPMTNLAVALIKDPSIAHLIHEVVCMGGSQDKQSTKTDFNFYSDPHAAEIVIASGIRVRMIGLDVTSQVFATPLFMTTLQELNNRVSREVWSMLKHSEAEYLKRGFRGRCIHDACIAACLIDPSLISFAPRRVRVNLTDADRLGRTDFEVCDAAESTVQVAQEVETDRVLELIAELLASYHKIE